MSIRIPSPSIVLNSSSWSIFDYKMDISLSVDLEKSTEDQLSDAAKECDKLYAKSDRYLSMILNAHGSGGWIRLGRDGIALSNAKLFSKFSSSVTIIYIITCEAAAV